MDRQQRRGGLENVGGDFQALALLIGFGALWAADMYYDIDAQKVVINEVQRVVKSGATALEILGIAKFGDGGTTDYAQFSQTGDLDFFGAADTISKSDGALTIQTTAGTGLKTLGISSAGALNFSAGAPSAWNLGAHSLAITSQNFNVSDNGNITAQAGYGLDTIGAGALNLGNTMATSVNIGNGAATSLGMGAGGNLTRTINIGTGTGADTINIGTGGGADVIKLGGNSGTLAIDTGDWDISTTGEMTGISGITNDGSYAQTGTGTFGTGTGAVSLNGSTSVTGSNTFTVGTGATSLGGTLGVAGLTTLGDNLTFSGTAARTITGPATGGITLAVAGGPIGLTTTGSGGITLNSAGQLLLQFGAAGGFTLGDGTTNYLQIAADGTLTLATGASDEIVLNPAGSAPGVVRLGPGDVILTAGGGAAMRTSGEEIMRGMAPIFGFDMPARTASTDYIAVSRELEDYPFPAAMTGTTRVHKFVIRYADTVNTQTTWQVYNTTDNAATATFTVPASASSNLEKGKSTPPTR